MQKILTNEWEVVEEQVNKSNIKRFGYKNLLGQSLTSLITQNKIRGYNTTECYLDIISRLSLLNVTSKDVYRRVWVSVCSRYTEQNAQINRLKNMR